MSNHHSVVGAVFATIRGMVVVAAVVLLPGCASTGSVRNADPDAGTARTYEASLKRTVVAAREAMTESGLMIEDVSQTENGSWLIMSKSKAGALSYGEIVRVIVAPADPEHTTVRVFTKRRISFNITAKGDYSKQILANIDFKLTTNTASSS
jgi:hypothetical protein